jgi:predicted metal-dependent RNase
MVRCAVSYIPLEGRSPKLSIQQVIRAMAPNKVIVVHGTNESTKSLAAFCRTMHRQLSSAAKMDG